MNTDYIEALQVDNFLQILTPFERTLACQFHAGRTLYIPRRVKALQKWVVKNKIAFKNDFFRYSQDRELLWWDDKTDNYRSLSEHPLYKLQIGNIKQMTRELVII